MARKRMVTRTITTTQAIVLYVDETTNATEDRAVMIPFGTDKKNECLKWILENMEKEESDSYVPVLVKNLTPIETKYGMPESDFIAHSTVITE